MLVLVYVPATPAIPAPAVPTNDLDLDKSMTYVIAQPCVDFKDKACVEECPVDCIYEGERSLYIHPDESVDCGACEPVCPVIVVLPLLGVSSCSRLITRETDSVVAPTMPARSARER